MKNDDEPLTDVIIHPIIPPVHDSARESFRPFLERMAQNDSAFEVVRRITRQFSYP